MFHVCFRLMATNFPSDNIPYPRYICNICGVAKNFNGFLPAEHSEHNRFSLTCDICHLVLHNPRLALIHLSNHQHPLIRRVCLSPPPPPPTTPASPIDDLSHYIFCIVLQSVAVMTVLVGGFPSYTVMICIQESPANARVSAR